jgi:hypothetical protein
MQNVTLVMWLETFLVLYVQPFEFLKHFCLFINLVEFENWWKWMKDCLNYERKHYRVSKLAFVTPLVFWFVRFDF